MGVTIGRVGELELRFSDKKDSHLVESLEIVHWSDVEVEEHEDGIADETIACWRWDGLYSSPDLVFVGQRPFVETVNKEGFWVLAEQGNKIANSIWEIEIQALRMAFESSEENDAAFPEEEEIIIPEPKTKPRR